MSAVVCTNVLLYSNYVVGPSLKCFWNCCLQNL